MTHYSMIVLIISLVVVAMCVGIRTNPFLDRRTRLAFTALFLLAGIANVAEFIAADSIGVPGQQAVLMLFKFLELSLAPIVPTMVIICFAPRQRYGQIAVALSAVNILLQVTSLFTGWVFHVDALVQYHRGALYYVYVATYMIVMALGVSSTLRVSKEYQNSAFSFFCTAIFIILFAVLVQLWVPSMRLDWVCVILGCILFYIHYIQLSEQIDGLSRLLNRRSYDCHIARLNHKATIVYVDIDHFKCINDTFGHAFGDECIIGVSMALREAFSDCGTCYRYGGDEFCVIVPRDRRVVKHALDSLEWRIAQWRTQNVNYPTISFGSARYIPGETRLEDVLAAADANMYQMKRSKQLP